MIIGIISGVGGIIGSVWAIMKSLLKKFEKQISKNIDDKMSAKISGINEKLEVLDENQRSLSERIDKNERDRLRNYITSFHEDLVNGKPIPSEYAFQNIFRIYDKYRDLKGNSFIVEIMKYIQEVYDKKNHFK